MEIIYNKLVRDKIPNIIKEKGETSIVKTLDEVECKNELEKNYTTFTMYCFYISVLKPSRFYQ